MVKIKSRKNQTTIKIYKEDHERLSKVSEKTGIPLIRLLSEGIEMIIKEKEKSSK